MSEPYIFENEEIIMPGGYTKIKFKPSGTFAVDTSTMVLIGTSEGGIPFDATEVNEDERFSTFTDPNDAKDTLRKGDLLDAVLIAFSPTSDPNLSGARKVVCIRSNPAEKSTIILEADSAASEVIDLYSADYGKHTKNTAVQVDNPSATVKTITVFKDGDDLESENLYNPLFTVNYGGTEASGDITFVSDTGVFKIFAGATTIFEADVADFPTVGELVDAIAADSDFTVEALNASFKTEKMDDIEVGDSIDCKGADTIIKGTYEYQLWFLNQISEFTTAAQKGTSKRPLDSLAKTFLTGGTHTTPTTQNWTDAIALADKVEAFYQIDLSGDIAIAQLNKAAVKFSNKVKIRRERMGGSGAGDYEGTDTYAVRLTNAKGLNSFLYIYGASPIQRYNSEGVFTTFEPKFLPVFAFGINSGNGPSTAATFKPLDAVGNPEVYEQDEIDAFIKAGCQIVTINPRTGVPRILRSVTTHQGADLIPSEMSMVATALAMAKNFRVVMEETFVGKNMTSNERGVVEAKAREILDSYVDSGYLTGDDVQAAYQITEFNFVGDKVTIVADLTETPVLNFIFTLMNISAYGL